MSAWTCNGHIGGGAATSWIQLGGNGKVSSDGCFDSHTFVGGVCSERVFATPMRHPTCFSLHASLLRGRP